MSSSGGAEQPPSSATEANGPAIAMDAKLMVGTGHGDVKKLKDLVNKEDSDMMVVVMAKQAAPKVEPRGADMDPHLLALASSGSSEELESLLNGEVGQACSNNTNRAFATQQGHDDVEAKKSLLEGVTAEGDNALHVVATYGQGDTFWYESANFRLEQNRKLRRTERDAVATYGDGDNFSKSASIIYSKANHLLFEENKKGDTPLHCAARAGKSNMVAYLIGLAQGEDRVKELLRKENKDKETALHEAVRIGRQDIVELLMEKDPQLACFPEQGASPLYLAIMLRHDFIVDALYTKSHHKLSYSGQNGQNALHAAVLRGPGLTKKLLEWNVDLTTQRDKNGNTPLHFAAAAISRVCRQVLEANADALYQPDHAGVFPIHVAASVGILPNVAMFVKKCPGCAGLRDAKGGTFLHVAVEKQKALIISDACRNLSLSWIMNMRDNDGNTALHLAVEIQNLLMFCSLLGTRQVNLNLTNKGGETPLDISNYKFVLRDVHYIQNTEILIYHTLRFSNALHGVCRWDRFEDYYIMKQDASKEMKVLKDSTGTLCVGSVLIASVTYGATFAVPGGYIADDHNNGGTPIFARRYAFEAFVMSNSLAFVLSAMATASLMFSGTPTRNNSSRKINYVLASWFLPYSIKCLATAFAIGAYVVLSPVAHKTAVATCALGCLVMLYANLEFLFRHLVLLPPLCIRKGPIWALVHFASAVGCNILIDYWPLIVIFAWAAYARPHQKMVPPVPLQAPAPSA